MILYLLIPAIVGLFFRRTALICGIALVLMIGLPFYSMVSINDHWLVLLVGELVAITVLSWIDLARYLSFARIKGLMAVFGMTRKSQNQQEAELLLADCHLWAEINWKNLMLVTVISSVGILLSCFAPDTTPLFEISPYQDLTAVFIPAFLMLIMTQIWMPLILRRAVNGQLSQEISMAKLPGNIWLLPTLAILISWVTPISDLLTSIF
jgi:hypothetical protein